MDSPVVTDINLIHRFVSPPGWSSDEYAVARGHHGIVYVISGRAEYRLGDGRRIEAEAGDCLYMPRGSVSTTVCSPSEGFVHMTVNFDLLGDAPLLRGAVRLHPDNPLQLEQVFSALVQCWSVRHPHYAERCMSLLYELIHLLLCETESPPTGLKRRLLPARDYLDAHFREDFPLEALPAMCDLSPTYFRRLFRSCFHETAADYRRRLRIACAADLLITGQYSVTETAQLCGYPDPAYFSRMFHKTMGESPTDYCARMRT